MMTSVVDTSSTAPSSKPRRITKLAKFSNSLDFSDESFSNTSALVSTKALSIPDNNDNNVYEMIRSDKSNTAPGNLVKYNEKSNYSIEARRKIFNQNDKNMKFKDDSKVNQDFVPILILSNSKKIYNREFTDKVDQKSKTNYIKQMQHHELKSHHSNKSLKHFDNGNVSISNASYKATRQDSIDADYAEISEKTTIKTKSVNKNTKTQVCEPLDYSQACIYLYSFSFAFVLNVTKKMLSIVF